MKLENYNSGNIQKTCDKTGRAYAERRLLKGMKLSCTGIGNGWESVLRKSEWR